MIVDILILLALLFLFLPLTFVAGCILFQAIKAKTILGTMFVLGFFIIMCAAVSDLSIKLFTLIF